MASRRVIAALILAQLARVPSSERAIRRELRSTYAEYVKTVRALMERSPADQRRSRISRLTDALRDRVSPVLRAGSVYQAQRGYNATLTELTKLGEEVERKQMDDEERTRLLGEVDDIIRRRLEPLPDRVINRANRGALGRDRDTRAYSRTLADDLARATSTYARVHGERIANEEQGTGWWQWITVGDDRVRRTHRLANREKRRIGTLFSNRTRFPRDPLAEPSERENCRCHTKPCRPPGAEEVA